MVDPVHRFSTFKEASDYARRLALVAGRRAFLKRPDHTNSEWTVSLTKPLKVESEKVWVRDEMAGYISESEDDEDWGRNVPWGPNEDPDAERHLLAQELNEDNDWHALSEEGGWYYPNDFEGGTLDSSATDPSDID